MKSLKVDDKVHSVLMRIKREKRKRDVNDVIVMLLSERGILEQQRVNVEVKPQVDETLKC
ncbi:MAG: hypothetical protein QW270_05715 [Candidatus Bathyarchaeia archaeon]